MTQPKIYVLEDFQKIAIVKGGKCLSTEYKNTKFKLTFECKKNHVFKHFPLDIKDKWCNQCSLEKIQTKRLNKIKIIIKNNEGKLLTKCNKIKNLSAKLTIKCKFNHTFTLPAKKLVKNNWCKYCLKKKFKYDINTFHEIAHNKNGVCLSTNYKNSKTKLKFKCKNNHKFTLESASVINKSWCRKCYYNEQHEKTDKKIKEVVESKGGKILKIIKDKKHKKVKIKCKNKHTWTVRAVCITHYNYWCDKCKINKTEEFCKNLFEAMFNEKFIKIRPSWLKSTKNRNLELDGYCEKLNLAFEYNGIRHFKKINKTQNLDIIQENDKIKLLICKSKNINLIVIPNIQDIKDIFEFIKNECKNNNIHIPNEKINLNSIKLSNTSRLDGIEEIIKNKNGKHMGYNLDTPGTPKLVIKCNKKHIFFATASQIKQNSWCGDCAKNKPFTMEKVKEIITNLGGECLFDTYKSNQELQVKCEKGHTWDTNMMLIIHSKRWCPYCSRRRQLVTQNYVESLAALKNGKCLSNVQNVRESNKQEKDKKKLLKKLEWMCENGHIWKMFLKDIRKGEWCQECKNTH